MIKKLIVILSLVIPSFLLGGYLSLNSADNTLRDLESNKNYLIDLIAETQHHRLEAQLEHRTQALEHFINADKSGETINKAIKEYLSSTSDLINSIEKNAAHLTKAEARKSVEEKVRQTRERLEELKFGYNF